MNSIQEQAIQAIEAQQAKVRTHSNVWLVGEQLKDICRMEPRSAELIAQDLAVASMGITSAEKKIAAFAEKRGGRVETMEADRILREFYGLPPAGEGTGMETETPAPAPVPIGRINALDFL